jgi:hypothetical protein
MSKYLIFWHRYRATGTAAFIDLFLRTAAVHHRISSLDELQHLESHMGHVIINLDVPGTQ